MLKYIYLIYFFFSFSLLLAQTFESEPNDNCGDSGIITISSHGTVAGFVDHTDAADNWYLQYGSSGLVSFTLDLPDDPSGATVELLCYNSDYCSGSPVQTTSIGTGSATDITLVSTNYYVLRIYPQAFDGTSYSITISGGVLPVELTSFSADLEEAIVKLKWETASEVNNYGFEVERSIGTQNARKMDKVWEKIGFVEGFGNSSSPKYYSFSDKSLSESGEYYYRLKQIDIDGQFEYSDIININRANPKEFSLTQNYPNPFNPSTTINYSIPERTSVKIVVYNLFGEEIGSLVDEVQNEGLYSVNFDGKDLASGIYIYQMETDNFHDMKKFILLK